MSCLELSAVLYVLNAAAVLIGQTRGIFNFIVQTNIFSSFLTVSFSLQCFDAVGWAAGRASGP